MNKAYKTPSDYLEFDINENFLVSGVGIVVSGLIKSGTAKLNQTVLLGPDSTRLFKSVIIKSIHVNRVAVDEAQMGEFACFSLKPAKASEKLDRCDFRKGMVLLDPMIKPEPVWDFEANIHVLHHPTTMKEGYQAVMHCGVIRQSVEIKKIKDKEILRTGDMDTIQFKFMYAAEYLK